MVCNTQNYWVSVLCPLSGILNSRKQNVSETGYVRISHLRTGTNAVSETLCFLMFRSPEDGQSPETQQFFLKLFDSQNCWLVGLNALHSLLLALLTYHKFWQFYFGIVDDWGSESPSLVQVAQAIANWCLRNDNGTSTGLVLRSDER
jgi:hypothetical protein